MRTGEFLEGVVEHLRTALPAEWQGFQLQQRASMIKLWYREPRLHYEVWPVSGRDLIEVGLHFEADQAINHQLVARFDPSIIQLKAALDGAVDLEQWTATWGHLFWVFHVVSLDRALQLRVGRWLATLIPIAEPILQAALDDLGPLATGDRPGRDWAEWRRRRERRAVASRLA